MNSEEEIFEAAAALPAGQRVSYLESVCRGQPELRARLEALLRSHDATGFMDKGTAIAADPLDPMPGSNPHSEQAGDMIGRYKLIQRVGEGGFGVVWMAEQVQPVTRRVALKILKAGMDTSEVIRRFEVERQALAMMDHPGIATVFDGGTTDHERPYFVMEYVPGETIIEFCDRRRLSLRQRLELFVLVCEAVQHAHTKGVIHRDIKPRNVLITSRDGTPIPKVIDFGLAKATERSLTENTMFTRSGQMLGTIEYMSPEQAGIGPVDIDTRTDVYALGVLLYELLAGLLPFDVRALRRAGYEAMFRVLKDEDAPKPSIRFSTAEMDSAIEISLCRGAQREELTRELRRELDWIPLKALRKDRAERYQTPTDLARDVRRYLDGEALEAGPESAIYRTRKFVRRHRGAVLAVAVVLVTLATGLAGTLWMAANARRAETEQRRLAVNESSARKHIEYTSYIGNVEMAAAAMDFGQMDRVRKRLDDCPEHLRGWEWHWLHAQSDRSLAELKGPTAPLCATAFSPDGTRVAVSEGHAVRLLDALTGKNVVELKGHTGPVYSAAFSPDGTKVITAAGNDIARVWDVVTGKKISELTGSSWIDPAPVFSPDGTKIITISPSRVPDDYSARVWVWDSATGQNLVELKGHAGMVYSAAFNRDATRIATASWDDTARVWDTATGRSLAELMGHMDPVYSAVFSPDGTKILTASKDNTARLWDAETGRSLAELSGHAGLLYTAVFSPCGRRIVTASADRTGRLWDTSTGECLAELAGHTGPVSSAAFSPDGTMIVTASWDGTVRSWEAATGESLAELKGHTTQVTSATFSRDGSRLFTFSGVADDRSARVWDTTAGESLTENLRRTQAIYSNTPSHGQTSTIASPRNGTSQMPQTPSEKLRTLPRRPRDYKPPDDERLQDRLTGQSLNKLSSRGRADSPPAFSRDGTKIVNPGTANHRRNLASVWDPITGETLADLEGHTDQVLSAAFGPDGTRVVTASRDKTGRVWDATTGQILAVLMGHTGPIHSAAFSLDGTKIITASADQTARVWDASTGQSLTELKGHTGPVRFATFSPDGKRIMTASLDGTMRVWDAATGQELLAGEGHPVGSSTAAFSIDETRIVIWTSDGTVWLWDATTGRSHAELKGHVGYVSSAAFSPDGARIVTASADGTARVWEAATGRSLVELKGHGGYVSSAAFSPDGTRIVTASDDLTVRVWDAATGQSLAEIKGHTGPVLFAIFSPDGTQILTESDLGTLQGLVIEANLKLRKASMNGVVSRRTSHKIARVWNSRPYRERFPAVQRVREAVAKMRPRIQTRLDEGVAVEQLAAEMRVDISLKAEERTATLALLEAARKAQISKE